MRKINLFWIICFLVSIVSGQNTKRKYKKAVLEEGILNVYLSDGAYRISFYSDKIVETSFIPMGEHYSSASHAVVLHPEKQQLKYVETSGFLSFKSGGLEVKVIKQPFQIQYKYQKKPLISEGVGYVKKDSLQVLDFILDNDEALYGGGARALGMNRRGHRLELYNKADYGYETNSKLMNFTMPIALSSKIYMIHFDNPNRGWLDLDSGHDNTLKYETIGGRKTYQIIVGETWEKLLNSYTNLTGKQPIPPRWAFGNFASRFGYHSENEARNVVEQFKKDKIPLDAIVLDLYWFGREMKGSMGNLEFFKDSFPSPEKMIRDFKELGVKTVLISEPFILKTSKNWNQAVSLDILGKTEKGDPYEYDFYFGRTGLIDIFKEEAKNWFWQRYRNLIEMGVAGWWGDLGEPEVHPQDLQHVNGTADEVHNVYGHYWAKLISEGYKKDFKEQRPFVLMRAGYSGSQRFGMIPWSGDVNRSWGGLQSQMEISLQMGMQGMSYMHSDLGGFAGSYEDDELYVRWLQYGVFQPIFRPHAQEELASEPIFKKNETKLLAKKAIELRYSLLPYNYTMAFENSQYGTPLMRPLIFEEPDNKRLQNEARTYLWGKDLLVHPIVFKGQEKDSVYFPKSNNWYNFYSGRKYKGGKQFRIPLERDKIPVFVRGGAFIPRIDPIGTTDLYSLSNFDVHFYFDKEVASSNGKIYNDDGKSPNTFEKDRYELIHFESEIKKKDISIHVNYKVGLNYKRKTKHMRFITHNLEISPKKVLVDGKKVDFSFRNNQLQMNIVLNKKNTIKLCF